MTLPIPTKESPTWVEVPYLETTDRVIGGIAGSSNASALALAERTDYLLAQITLLATRIEALEAP